MKVKLKDVLANPFRDMDAYPIHRQKIEQLKKSIQSTEFWDNIVARQKGDKIEIAYGHHRLTALREMYDGDKSFNFIVRELDDKEMIKIMAHENLDEWGHDSAIERETVKAIVHAFGNDQIYLPKPKGRDDSFRLAPSFCLMNQVVKILGATLAPSRPYNADTIVGFLGGTMSTTTVKYTLRALGLMEQGHITEAQLKGLTSAKAREVVDETNRALKKAEIIKKDAEREALSAATPVLEKLIINEAKKKANAIVKVTTQAVSKSLQSGFSKHDAKAAATNARIQLQPEVKELPEINDAAKRLAAQLMRLLDSDYDPAKKLLEVIKHKNHLSDVSIQNLDRGLEMIIEYAQGYRSRLGK